MTQAALASKMIKKELKEKFPTIKFAVHSQNYAGGDSVHIQYENGVPSKEVDKVVAKYQYGNFNGMEDIYEYSNSRDDIPQAKYVQVQRDITSSVRERVKENIAKKFGIKEINNEQEWYDVFILGLT